MSAAGRIIVGPLAASHRERVAEILRSTENFREEEVDVALELFDESFAGEDYVLCGAFAAHHGTADWGLGTEDWGLWKTQSQPSKH